MLPPNLSNNNNKKKRIWFFSMSFPFVSPPKQNKKNSETKKNEASPSPNILHPGPTFAGRKKVPLAGWLEENYHIFREELAPRSRWKISPISPWIVWVVFFSSRWCGGWGGGREGWMKNMPFFIKKRGVGVWWKCEGRMVITWCLDGFSRSCFIFLRDFWTDQLNLSLGVASIL